jgi:ABC-type transport system substrate-binding protein
VKSTTKRARLSVIAALLAVTVLAAACGGSGDSQGTSDRTIPETELTKTAPTPPQRGGTLKFGLDAETATGWDPANSQWAGAGTIVSRAIFDRLAELDADGNPRPNLAESIESNDNFTSWTIKLRPGIVFHDGEKLDANAVRLNLERAATSVLLGAAIGSFLGSVEVVDDLTVRVTTKRPWSTFPNSLTTQAGVVAAPAQIASSAPAQQPIGTGPFVFQNWVQDSKLTVTRNPNYWQKDESGTQLPYLDGIEFTVLADPTARGAALESGSVDAFNTFEPDPIQRFLEKAQAGQVQLLSNANAEDQTQFVGLNTAKPPFDDPLARQIVVTGLDTKSISQVQYYGLFPPSNSLFSPSSPYYAETTYPTYDPAKAQALHEEYKKKTGKPLSFKLTLPGTAQFKTIGEAAQAQAANLGVSIELNLVDQATLIVDALTGNFEATGFITFGEPPIDSVLISSETVKPLGQLALNFTRLADPQIQAALDAIQQTNSTEKRIEQWKIIQQRMAENLNFMFVVRNRAAVIFANNVYGMSGAKIPGNIPVKATTSPFLGWAWKAA